MSWFGITDTILEQYFDTKSKDFMFFLIQVIFGNTLMQNTQTVKYVTIG